MSAPVLVSLRLDLIDYDQTPRERPIDPDAVRMLALSLKENQRLISPVVVRPLGDNGKYLLVVGAHRCAAAAAIGWEEVDAIITDASDVDVALMEVDENLYRPDLTDCDLTFFWKKRLELFEFKNGKMRRGRRLGKSLNLGHLDDGAEETKLFYREVKEKFGVPRSTAARLIRRARNIPDEIWAEIRKKPSAYNGSLLDKIADCEVKAPGSIGRQIEKTGCDVREAVRVVRAPGEEKLADMALDALQKAWERASPDVRARFVAWQQTQRSKASNAG